MQEMLVSQSNIMLLSSNDTFMLLIASEGKNGFPDFVNHKISGKDIRNPVSSSQL